MNRQIGPHQTDTQTQIYLLPPRQRRQFDNRTLTGRYSNKVCYAKYENTLTSVPYDPKTTLIVIGKHGSNHEEARKVYAEQVITCL